MFVELLVCARHWIERMINKTENGPCPHGDDSLDNSLTDSYTVPGMWQVLSKCWPLVLRMLNKSLLDKNAAVSRAML